MPDVDRAVGSYVCDVVACSTDRIVEVHRFPSGERHDVYKVTYADPAGSPNEVVARISLSKDADDAAQAEREARVLERVQGVGAPLLYDFRRQSRWFETPAMCMQFVQGEKLDTGARPPTDVERLGNVVSRVHALRVDDLLEWFPITSPDSTYLEWRLEIDTRKLPAIRDPLPDLVQRRLLHAWDLVNELVERVRRGDSFDGTRSLLHGDVAAGNIIWGPAPVLIDWEYARLGDPADEIAYIFGQNGLTSDQRDAFWRGYGSSQPQPRLQEVVDRVGWWEPINLLGSVMWWVQQWSRRTDADAAGQADPSAPKLQSYYINEAVLRLTQLEQLLSAPAGPEPS